MQAPTVLYIVGAGRSGTTIFERVISSLPGYTDSGELVDVFRLGVLANERCGCGEWFRDCAYWQAIGAEAFGGWDPEMARRMSANRARGAVRQRYALQMLASTSWLIPEAELRFYADTFSSLYRAITEVSGAPIVVDASKEPIHGIAIATQADPDFRMVHMVRDPRAVAYSWSKAGVVRPNANRARQHMRTYGARDVARMWNRANFWGSALRHRVDHSSFLRYEDFVRAPVAQVTRVLADLELPGNMPAVQGGVFNLSASHALGGNPGRFLTGPIEVSPDDGWRIEMSRRDRWTVSTLTAASRCMLPRS